jgi:hypothetical protein
MRIFAVILLILIVISLGSALYFLIRDHGTGPRTVRALAVRVGLSIVLFLLLLPEILEGRL